ncbi:MAG TPA: hypothetical protein VGH60_09670 [Solirubrobacteraceae bacterium]
MRTATLLACALLAASVAPLSGAASASAAVGAPAWSLRSVAYPSDFTAADNALCEAEVARIAENAHTFCDTYVVVATNVGAKATGNATVFLKDTLPAGLVVQHVSLFLEQAGNTGTDLGTASCTVAALLVECAAKTGHPVPPDAAWRMYVSVTVPPATAPASLTNAVSVSAVNTSTVEATGINTVESGPPAFGPDFLEAAFRSLTGESYTVAGGHPYELNTVIGLASVVRETPQDPTMATSIEDARDVIVDLPVGMTGSAVSAPQCTLARLGSKGPTKEQGSSGCPTNTIIGHVRTVPEGQAAANFPIYNLVPEHGYAAELGFIDLTGSTHVLYVSLAPSTEGYVLRTTTKEIPQIALTEIVANVYGNPTQRDGVSSSPGLATFTSPSDCSGKPLVTKVLMDSWQHPGSYNPDGTPNLSDPNWVSKSSSSPAVTGCEQLAGLFEPSVTGAPTTARAGEPTGLVFTVSVPQKTSVEGDERSTPPLRDTTVTLPEGMTVDPSSANGLGACSLEQVGISEAGIPNAASPACPNASRLGTVEVETPALPSEVCKAPQTPLEQCPGTEEREHVFLSGSIYLARQDENPFGSLLAIYIVVDDRRTGVIAKIPAKLSADPVTGRLTTTVTDTPQFPFSQLRTHFFGGDTGALTNPMECGSYSIVTSLTPWSAPESGPSATPAASFGISQAADGGACATPGFAPSLRSGTTNSQAGAYSPLGVTFSRQDTEQDLAGISVTTPPGLLGSLRNVVQCPEPQAAKGECGPESLIGEATTTVGAGPHPYMVHGGRVYLTGPYNNGPFGLSIVVPTTAGPFTLTGNGGFGREIVRASIRVDPHTAQITVLSDPLPTIIQGIPLQIRTVNVTVDRPGFTFNPTNCSQLASSATFTSTKGATSTTTSPFYASNCASLPFHPSFTAFTAGRTSKARGASLTVKVGSGGGQANIAKVKVALPLQLPSWLPTLQKACVDSVFDTNPAACPAGSAVGIATASTPVLAHSLTGPAYLVSHGGVAFPDLEIVLQGEGITLVLDGNTNIKKGITTSTFNTVPDAPVSTFELVLPQGPGHVLATNLPVSANNSLCGQTLRMPTEIIGQNGVVIHQSTTITATGCPKTKSLTRAQKLTKALKACHKQPKGHKRKACERQARKRYGPAKKTKHKQK